MAAPPTFVRAPEATASDLFQTSDLDEAQAAMASTYGDNRIRRTSRGSVNLNLWLTRAGRMNLGYTNFEGDIRITAPPLSTGYIVATPSAGHLAVSCGRDSVVLTPGRGVVLGPTESLVFEEWSPDCKVFGARIDRHDLESDLQTMLGRPAPGPIRFKFLIDFQAGEARSFLRAIDLIHDEARLPDGMSQNPTLSARMAQLARDALLVCQPHNFSEELAGPARQVLPRTIQQAVEFIDAGPAQITTVTDVAAAACLSVRAVEVGFKRHLGLSPMAYVRDIRLARAHADLLESDPATTTVSLVAGRWGFAHLGRFTQAYRHRYGTLPSHTLRADGAAR
jgi:AraC-like DNA-binding protein